MTPEVETVSAARRAQFLGALAALEREEDVWILFACESGSRAWGFPSQDSDYDVRFVYVQGSRDYLGLGGETRADVIERPIEDSFDLGGWDLRKALRLFHKGNSPLFEWLGSPIVYRENAEVLVRWRELRGAYFQPAAAFHHYQGLARREAETVLAGGEIKLKKACYFLRALLAMRWLEAGLGVVPTAVAPMVDKILPASLHAKVEELFRQKAAGDERSLGVIDPELLAFFRESFEVLAELRPPASPKADSQPLEDFLAQILKTKAARPRFLRGREPAELPGAPEWLRERLILLVRQGSHAYGTAHENSDLDLRGVAVAPLEVYLGYRQVFEQFEQSAPADVVVYELRKLIRLGAECNPGIFEMLWVEDEDVLVEQEAGRRLREERGAFLSKRARHTFAGYARHQLQRLRNHRAWLLDPPSTPPTRGEFGLPERTVIPADQLAAAESAIAKQLDRWQPALPDLDPGARQALLDSWSELLSQMSLGLDERFLAAGRRLGYDDNFLELLDRERHFENRLKNWRAYKQWEKNRNPQRAALEARFGYDTKHAMHLVRILRMGRELLETGEVKVRRPDARELLAIRNGAWSFDQLLTWAEDQDRQLDALLATTQLPAEPDHPRLERLCEELLGAYLF
jgi:uncharacterized protein